MVRYLHNRRETFIYAGIFGLLFLAPLLTAYIRTLSDTDISFRWDEVFDVWKILAVFLLLFLIHNFLLAPLLVYRRKKLVYFLGTACLLALFTTIACIHRPDEGKRHPGPPKEMMRNISPPRGHHPPHHPPLVFGQGDVVGFVLLFFMFGMNLGVKLYFKNEHDRKEMEELEKESLEHQLEYLKYQINPHFFMNTLNNIHALVDIDPEKAKSSIVVLSKMMRYVLYEGNNRLIPIQREITFINNYISLMRMRYTDKVRISIDMPQGTDLGMVPPLLLITFVENAFKHGVSYQQESFIDLKLTVGDQICFHCKNSRKTAHSQSLPSLESGVGLANVRRRLDLLYKNQYMLNIRKDDDTYEVELKIPIS